MERCSERMPTRIILWNLFQNDIAMTENNSNLHMYADDMHQLYKVGNQIKSIEKENFLKANYKKYQTMKLSPNQSKSNANSDGFTLRIDDFNIASLETSKY